MSQKSLKRRKLGCQPTTKFHGEISVFLTGYQEKLSKEIGSLRPQLFSNDITLLGSRYIHITQTAKKYVKKLADRENTWAADQK